MPYANHFLGFMIQFIPDINFKISLTSIKIISKHPQLTLTFLKQVLISYNLTDKLLSLEYVSLKKHY